MKQKALGTEGMLLAILLAALLSALNFFIGHPVRLEGNLGICLPSPNLWDLPDLASWITNLVLIIGMGITFYLVNKSFSIVQTTATVLPAAIMVLVSTNPWINALLDTSTIMMWVNTLALIMMFNSYKLHNATQQVFVVATMLSLGSMFQYAFLFMIPAYLINMGMMKVFRFKEICAFLMGLVAPYWVAIGLGIVPISSFAIPTFTNLFSGFAPAEDIFTGLLNIGITAILAVILGLNNMMKLYAGNTRRRLFNNAIMVLNIISIVAIAVDSGNITAYLGTLYLTTAVQIANLYALWNVPNGRSWLLFVTLLYLISFGFMVYSSFS